MVDNISIVGKHYRSTNHHGYTQKIKDEESTDATCCVATGDPWKDKQK